MRFALIFAVGLIATPVFAGKKERDCETFAYIAQQVADQRVMGTKKAKAIEMIAGQYEDTKGRFAKAVPPLADWIYSLPKDQADTDVETAYKEACIAN